MEPKSSVDGNTRSYRAAINYTAGLLPRIRAEHVAMKPQVCLTASPGAEDLSGFRSNYCVSSYCQRADRN